MTAVREEYQKIARDLKDELGKKNVFEVPRLSKIVVNVGMGRAHDDKAYRAMVVESLTQITGQRPVINKARMSIAAFKLREGMEIGASVTLRGQRMEGFLAKLIHVVLPRVRDFRGLSPKGFDGHGNYSLGLREHTVFPEISYDDVTDIHPLQITIVTTGSSDDEAYQVLSRLGMPFIKPEGDPSGA